MPRPKTKNLKLFTMKIEENQYLKYKAFAKSKNRPLAEIIKKLLDGEDLPETYKTTEEPKREYSPVDPELIRHISAIGNNLNQIARRLNQKEEFDVVPHLVHIEKQLQEIIDAH